MESRLIYESDKTFINRIQWTNPENSSESEWLYLKPKTLSENQIADILNKKLTSEILYLVIDRNQSEQIDKFNLIPKIKDLYGKTEFKVWDENFENVIEFKKEIYREGNTASR